MCHTVGSVLFSIPSTIQRNVSYGTGVICQVAQRIISAIGSCFAFILRLPYWMWTTVSLSCVLDIALTSLNSSNHSIGNLAANLPISVVISLVVHALFYGYYTSPPARTRSRTAFSTPVAPIRRAPHNAVPIGMPGVVGGGSPVPLDIVDHTGNRKRPGESLVTENPLGPPRSGARLTPLSLLPVNFNNGSTASNPLIYAQASLASRSAPQPPVRKPAGVGIVPATETSSKIPGSGSASRATVVERRAAPHPASTVTTLPATAEGERKVPGADTSAASTLSSVNTAAHGSKRKRPGEA